MVTCPGEVIGGGWLVVGLRGSCTGAGVGDTVRSWRGEGKKKE